MRCARALDRRVSRSSFECATVLPIRIRSTRRSRVRSSSRRFAMKVLFDGGLLEEVGPKKSAAVLVLLLKALVECNLAYLQKHPKTPHPYAAGIRYQREEKGQERWK